MIDSLRQGFKVAPKFSIEELPLAFDDASHCIYLVKNQSTELVIKLIRLESINKSAFWEVMTDLFNASLLTQFEKFEEIYSSIKKISPITTPELIQKLSIPEKKIFASQATYLQGKELNASDLNKTMITQLARHLSSCHQKTPPPPNWQKTLKTTLKKQLKKHPEINSKILEQIDGRFNKGSFGLIMPDLRWDQFLSNGKQITALIDLDALVMGPIELDWVILEYLLSAQQAEWFIAEYAKFTPPPSKIEEVREVYRTLLFTMNILGETSIKKWFKQPHLF